MACIRLADLNKRDNWNLLYSMVKGCLPFTMVDGSELIVKRDKKLLQALSNKSFKDTHFMDNSKSIWLPLHNGKHIRLSSFMKTESFGGVGGKCVKERQEQGLVSAINNGVTKCKKPIQLVIGDFVLNEVVGARKVTESNSLGDENYTDIIITTLNKSYRISAKGLRVSSIGGGGLKGLNILCPSILKDSINRSFEFYADNYPSGTLFGKKKCPEAFVTIPRSSYESIMRGCEEIGGPVDFMYVGPMDVDSDLINNTLHVSGSMNTIRKYVSNLSEMYVRIRRRSSSQLLDHNVTDALGYKSIFYLKGCGSRRLTVVTEMPIKAKELYNGFSVSS